MLRRTGLVFFTVFAAFSAFLGAAESSGGGTAPQGGQQVVSLLDTLRSGGVIGFAIVLVSIVSVALIIEQYTSLRRERECLRDLTRKLNGMNMSANLQDVLAVCEKQKSLLGAVMCAGLRVKRDYRESAMQDEAQHYSGQLYRKLEYLVFIGTAAPMLGLLGTVLGMMRSFKVIASSAGMAQPALLAGGISEALVTTCLGLIVALPTLLFHTTLRNMLDGLVADTGKTVESLVFGDKLNRVAPRPAAPVRQTAVRQTAKAKGGAVLTSRRAGTCNS
jgi:biopolymer transport protein ExbB